MTRVLCGGACVMLLVSAAASVAVSLVHYRQQELIEMTAVVQLTAGTIYDLFFSFPISS